MNDWFPGRANVNPRIYAFALNLPNYEGMLKVGYTTRSVRKRVEQQFSAMNVEDPPYEIVMNEPALRPDGTGFRDTDVHHVLRKNGTANPSKEWFRCSVEEVQAAIHEVATGQVPEQARTRNFSMRPEQRRAVRVTAKYFQSVTDDEGRKPHFLWNAKMRFGKTFAVYQLAKRMGWKRLLVLTFKPAVQSAWREDLNTHVDFAGWQFVEGNGGHTNLRNSDRQVVCFGSFQDFLGRNEAGGIKAKNRWAHEVAWDCVVLDEYHYGAWREKARELFESESASERRSQECVEFTTVDELISPIRTNAYLYLSGTPFRAIASGEFIEEQIFNWTYTDEQRAKKLWSSNRPNPYRSLPQMVLMTYRLPDSIRDVAVRGEFDEFDLNTFFEAVGTGSGAKFRFENEVQKWLGLIRGAHLTSAVDDLRLGGQKPPLPFEDRQLLSVLNHTFWFMPTIASCHAMRNLLAEEQNVFFHDYKVIVAAGSGAGVGESALGPVLDSMSDPLKSKTITLSCGKLTTGVSVRPWSGIFMLRNMNSPETYFQAAFRVQTPWEVVDWGKDGSKQTTILKEVCYVFDFAPDRALRQVAEYSCQLGESGNSAERSVDEFIQFLPVLAYDGSSMKRVNAEGILDYVASGTTATLLARRWESALLVNVDDETLSRLMGNSAALKAIESIEGFRSINKDIEAIINRSNAIQKIQKRANKKALSDADKRKLSEAEKERSRTRKMIRDKLIKFATRVPVFMYLTDYREYCLKDIIQQLEPALFRQVTGLTLKQFNTLVSLNVFNSVLMNDAVYKFKRYEDASLQYSGVDKHKGERLGLYDTVVEAEEVFGQVTAESGEENGNESR